MRNWYKYILNYENAQRHCPDRKYSDEYKEYIDALKQKGAYDSKKEFFKLYFYNAHTRFKQYDEYLKQNIKKEESVLSIGSGCCVNELLLIENGFDIICSDICQYCDKDIYRLFPSLRFIKYDVASSGTFENKFDCIISLSMFYLFNETELLKVFKNIARNLKPGGKLIFDYSGAADNLLTYTIDEIFCKFEAYLIYSIQRSRRRKCIVTKVQHGYRIKNEEVALIAQKAGFTYRDVKSSDYSTEIQKRSILLKRFPNKIVEILGKSVPYVRMFTFIKD